MKLYWIEAQGGRIFGICSAEKKSASFDKFGLAHTLILAGGITPSTHTHTLSMYSAIKEDLF